MINSVNVTEIFVNCLFKKEEIIDGLPVVEPIYVDGIIAKFGLHPERLKKYSSEINLFIDELPEQFKHGWSFLNLCTTKDGELWTGFHQVCEQLMVLGVAIGRIEYCLPKEQWDILPSGLPYIRIL